jgi:hypothetical protein
MAAAPMLVSGRNATLAEIEKEAANIWARVSGSGVDSKDDSGNDSLLESIRAEFADFAATFPLATRWIVQTRKFCPKVMKRFLLKYSESPLSTRAEYLEAQAEYLVMIYKKEAQKTLSGKRLIDSVFSYKKNILEHLQEEDERIAEAQKEAIAGYQAAQAANDAERRKRLLEIVRARAEAQDS